MPVASVYAYCETTTGPGYGSANLGTQRFTLTRLRAVSTLPRRWEKTCLQNRSGTPGSRPAYLGDDGLFPLFSQKEATESISASLQQSNSGASLV